MAGDDSNLVDSGGHPQADTLDYHPAASSLPEDGAELLQWLAGTWTLDPARCELPVKDSLDRSDPITMTIDSHGAFQIRAPRVVVPGDLGEFVADMGFSGAFRPDGDFDDERCIPVAVDGFQVTHRHLDTSGFNLPFSVEFIANMIFDAIAAHMPDSTVLRVDRDGSIDVIQMVSGEYRTGLVRKTAADAVVNMKLRKVVDARVEEITFLGRHAEMRDQIGPKPLRFRDEGTELKPPEWIRSHLNAAISYTRAKTVKLEVVITVSPAGRPFKLFGIDKAHSSMNFESPELVSTGAPQKVTMKGKAKLPNAPQAVRSTITWNVMTLDDEQWFNAGDSGPHTIYVTWDTPNTRTSYYAKSLELLTTNFMTPTRMEFVMDKLTGSATTVSEIATIIHAQVNSFTNPNAVGNEDPLVLANPSDIEPYRANDAWALLDDDNTHHGNCGEATTIMEMMLRLLGIPATQTHVFASSSLDVVKKSLNVRRNVDEGDPVGVGEETRYCEHHKMQETLMMSFAPAGTKTDPDNLMFNHGEGCVEVEDALYGGLVDDIYRAKDGLPASYNALLELEQWANGKMARPKRVRFQVWVPEKDIDNKHGNSFCRYPDPKVHADPAKNVVQEPAGVPVPK